MANHRESIDLAGDGGVFDGELSVTAYSGGVTLEITQEQAVDSYNHEFTCTIQLSQREKVEELVGVLTKWLGGGFPVQSRINGRFASSDKPTV